MPDTNRPELRRWRVGDLVAPEERPDQPTRVLEVDELNECCGRPAVRVLDPEGDEAWW